MRPRETQPESSRDVFDCVDCGSSPTCFGNRPNTVSESTVSNTELSELFGPHRVLGRELSEFLLAYYLCAKASFFLAELTESAVKLSEAQ